MEIFNIGPLELIIVLVIMFVLLGPDEMKRTARRIAIWIRNFVRSPMWAEITGMSQEIRELPKKLMEDTGLEETIQEVKKTTTAAAEEANQAVKESMEAARVQEVEHLRLQTQKLSPNAGQVIMPPRPSKAADADADAGMDTGDEAAKFAEAANAQAAEFAASANQAAADYAAAANAANAYTLEVDIASTPREPAQDQPVADVANTIMPPAEVVKKPRRKKAETKTSAEEDSASTDTPALTEGEVASAPRPRRATRRKVDPQTTVPGSNGSGPEEQTTPKDETNEPNAA